MKSMVVWCSAQQEGLGFSVEFACSSSVCVGFLSVHQYPPQSSRSNIIILKKRIIILDYYYILCILGSISSQCPQPKALKKTLMWSPGGAQCPPTAPRKRMGQIQKTNFIVHYHVYMTNIVSYQLFKGHRSTVYIWLMTSTLISPHERWNVNEFDLLEPLLCLCRHHTRINQDSNQIDALIQ